jgi:hypothetical protein
MIKTFQEWISVVYCHHCKSQTHTKETFISSVKSIHFGVKSYTNVRICKECHREQQLNKLFKSEKQE